MGLCNEHAAKGILVVAWKDVDVQSVTHLNRQAMNSIDGVKPFP